MGFVETRCIRFQAAFVWCGVIWADGLGWLQTIRGSLKSKMERRRLIAKWLVDST